MPFNSLEGMVSQPLPFISLEGMISQPLPFISMEGMISTLPLMSFCIHSLNLIRHHLMSCHFQLKHTCHALQNFTSFHIQLLKLLKGYPCLMTFLYCKNYYYSFTTKQNEQSTILSGMIDCYTIVPDKNTDSSLKQVVQDPF